MCGFIQKSMQRPFFSQSPKRVGSGPSRPPISLAFSDSMDEPGDRSLSDLAEGCASDPGLDSRFSDMRVILPDRHCLCTRKTYTLWP
jgi:hypothetical protein